MQHNADTYSDEELVIRALREESFFGVLIDRYADKLTRYIRRRAQLTNQDAEDLMQEIFIKVYMNLNGFDTALSFSSWIYRIAHNEVISWYRKHRRHSEDRYEPQGDEDVYAGLPSEFDLEVQHINQETAGVLRTAVAKLPDKYRDIMLLRYFEEKDYEEISDILRIPPGTVATRLSRAKAQLAKLITQSEL
ncbi:MAG: RNA polymerase sigma-70 factor (ECF subfamily) [Planctomycetota bacterium]